MAMTEVFLVRHGQTEWNAQLLFRGRKDIPLNERGRGEARAIAEALSDRSIDAVYTSPLTRAVETARPIATVFELEVQTVQGLIDISYGAWEGLTHEEARKRYPDQYNQWDKRPDLVSFPRGETLDAVKERSFGTFKDIVHGNANKAIAIISHRVVNKVLLCAVLGLSNAHFWEIRQDTGCINIVECRPDRFVLSVMNDTCHLKGLRDDGAEIDF
jgi:broad specificity phosphatase PhoE